MSRKLTPKQQEFADEYIKTGNAMQSAITAGYSKNYAKAQSSKMLENVGIKSYIDTRLEELKSERVADQQEVLEFLTRILRREEIEQVVVTLKKPTTVSMTNTKGEEYSKFAYEDVDDVVDVPTKNSDAMKAADILVRVLGLSKGFTPELDNARTQKAVAEAEIIKHKAKKLTNNSGDNNLLSALADVINGGDGSGQTDIQSEASGEHPSED